LHTCKHVICTGAYNQPEPLSQRIAAVTGWLPRRVIVDRFDAIARRLVLRLAISDCVRQLT
jgi:hypothetical protein